MKSRVLNEKQQSEFFEILGDAHNITANVVSNLFAHFKDTGIRFSPDDVITINSTNSKYVTGPVRTTCGLYIANKYLYEDLGIFGYINQAISGKTMKKIESMIAKALQAEDLTVRQVGDFIDRAQYLYGGPMAFIINTSISETIMSLPPDAKRKREELFAKHEKELDAGDPVISAKIEQEVTDLALKSIKESGDPAGALFYADCGIDPYNNYKTMFVMKGAVVDNTGEAPTGYKVVRSNYDDGITKRDMPIIADTVVTGAYSRGVLTADSGHDGKRFNNLFQNIRLQERGSDCGTTKYLTVHITKDNAIDYTYRWAVIGGKLVLLEPEVIEKYIDKDIQIRSGVFCKAEHPEYCSKCVGDRPYRIGIKNIGLAFNIVSGSMLNANMKSFHDIRIKTTKISPDDIMKYSTLTK